MIQASGDELRTAVAGQWLPLGDRKSGRDSTVRISGIGTDTREDLTGRLFVALRGANHDGHAFLAAAAARGAVAALVDRKGTLPHRAPDTLPMLEVSDTRVALSDLARFWRQQLRTKVVAITGSSGKTTTRRLVAAALSTSMKGSASPKSFNNDIGVPLTVLAAASDDGFLVAEIGMNHPGEIAPLARVAAPHIAVITMAGRAHIGGMGSVQAIIDEKATIVDGLNTSGMVFVNGDQPALVDAVRARAKPGVRVVDFGSVRVGSASAPSPCQWQLVARRVEGAGQVIRVREPLGQEWDCPLGLPGDYNAMNALAAIAVARALDISAEAIAGALKDVAPADMRMTRQRIGDIDVYNDAYNANPDSVLASLGAFTELAAGATRRVVVLGDMLELGSPEAVVELHAEVGRAVAGSGAHLAFFVGEGCAHAHEAAKEVQSTHFASLDGGAVETIAATLRPGDAVLVKGSRGCRMERLITALEARAGVACSTT